MKQKHILIVDDNALDRDLLKATLSKNPEFIVHCSVSGEECLERIRSEKIDIVLMDIMMPGIVGTDVLTKIREQFSAIELPVIMVTSKTETKEVIWSLQCGANDYITKPINFQIAASRIKTHLQLAELSLEASRLKEKAARDAMIVTYNHDINNPLAIALGYLDSPKITSPETIEKLKGALLRIADIVKKIKDLSTSDNVETESYTKRARINQLK